MVSTEVCNSRSFSWIVKSCIPNPQSEHRRKTTSLVNKDGNWTVLISSLPDDLLLECLSRVASSSLPSVARVCRTWSQLLSSSAFYALRRNHDLLRPTLYAVSVSDFGILFASHRVESGHDWQTSLFTAAGSADPSLSHARFAVIGPSVYVIGRTGAVRYNSCTQTVLWIRPMLLPRKKFAAAAINGKIYVSGGSRSTAVEEYDPATGEWTVFSDGPRRRYGCIGTSVGTVFYSIGGLKIGCRTATNHEARMEAHVYASSMDLFDVENRTWLRTRHVPGGGCVVAACAANGFVYVLASHAVEISFWRFDGRRTGPGFGTWFRLKAPPIPAQVRLDGTVRFSCVALGDRVVLVQIVGCVDDLLRRSGRTLRSLSQGLVLIYQTGLDEWSRGPNLPELLTRAGCVCVDS